MARPGSRCLLSRFGGLTSSVAVFLAALFLVLTTVRVEACTACVNDDTRKFLKLFLNAIPEVYSSWSGKLDGDYCSGVTGVTCSTATGLVSVDLNRIGLTLTGSLPSLAADKTINGSNVLVGSLAATGRGVSGTLPATWEALERLENLDLSGNKLTGALPEEWKLLVNLRTLYLDNNKLRGTLPSAWNENMTNLSFLHISANKLSGGLPEWPDMLALSSVDLHNNAMHGPLNASWAGLPLIVGKVHLFGNSFCDCVPSTWLSNAALTTAVGEMGSHGTALMATNCATANACKAEDSSDAASAGAVMRSTVLTVVAAVFVAFLTI